MLLLCLLEYTTQHEINVLNFMRHFFGCISQGDTTFVWPDSAVPAVTALEKASHDALSTDFQKYNQKMRQLVFNLKVRGLLICLLFMLYVLGHGFYEI